VIQNSLSLPLDAFIRSIKINQNTPHAIFLGAGASVSSSVLSAYLCIWKWKLDIFLTQNPTLVEQFTDPSLPSIQDKIQKWLDSEDNYPLLNSSEEYSFYIEKCYPISSDRRQFFQDLVNKSEPYIGYQLLCLMAESDLIRSVWTTNFDGLTNRAAVSSNVIPIEIGLDTTNRLVKPPQKGELQCISLHGDYRYDFLKNTEAELQSQNDELKKELIQRLANTPLIVIGYSGRDESIMSALKEAYSHPGSGKLYWCGYGNAEAPPQIEELIIKARSSGREAYYVNSQGFDDVMIRLSLSCLQENLLKKVKDLQAKFIVSSNTPVLPFRVKENKINSLIKSNLFPILLPTEILQFEAESLKGKGSWKRLNEIIENTEIVAGLLKGKVLAFGNIEDIRNTFKDKINGVIESTPIVEEELLFNDGVITSLMTQALVRSISRLSNLNTDNKSKIWDASKKKEININAKKIIYHDAVLLSVRRYSEKNYLILKPTLICTQSISDEDLRELKRKILTKQYNKQFNDAIENWRKLLFPKKYNGDFDNEFNFPSTSKSFKFKVSEKPVFASISDPLTQKYINVPENISIYIQQKGVQFSEPNLIFSNRQGNNFQLEQQPIKGIVNNRPYDFPLTLQGLSSEIRIGIICPELDSNKLSEYLLKINQRIFPNSKTEYLLEYPGFSQAFGTPVNLPQPGENTWFMCSEIDSSLNIKNGSEKLRNQINNCIKSLRSINLIDVVLVYIPDRWKKWEKFTTDDESFDLHDFIKAYCVQSGIATQFLRQKTLQDTYQCQVFWWLSLALYVKSMRTPWLLESLNNDTAFAGIGYSLSSSAKKGEKVILGCSHIYNSSGLGLKYSLSKIEDPLFFGRQKNPYMSREDASRLGDSIRRLFYEARMCLPKRVVIHKRTPFLQSEREGLLQGLSGIEIIDMLEINIEPSLRYVASKSMPENRFQIDNFPVRRGTSIVLDDRKALLWAHGSTNALNRNKQYYLGGNRIPAPLSLIRHYGSSSLETLATEILGLSKMDWNNFDMYDKLPVTIQSSNAIARIGSLLDRFGHSSYDYRLFM
jgi:SIR2-like domain